MKTDKNSDWRKNDDGGDKVAVRKGILRRLWEARGNR